MFSQTVSKIVQKFHVDLLHVPLPRFGIIKPWWAIYLVIFSIAPKQSTLCLVEKSLACKRDCRETDTVREKIENISIITENYTQNLAFINLSELCWMSSFLRSENLSCL